MGAEDNIIRKIQHLLALATSDNEHEAKAAAEKAQALLVKYNLDIQEVKNKDLEYIETQVASEPYLRWHQPFVIDILQDFFFVKVLWHNTVVGHSYRGDGYNHGYARKFRKDIMLFGSKTNVKIAHYVFDYLSTIYQRLWLEYKSEHGLGEKSRKSYYKGLTQGLSEKLTEIRHSVEQQCGLVLVADPKLNEHLKDVKGHNNPYRSQRDLTAEEHGFEAGRNIQIAKPIESKSENLGKTLTGKKKV